MRSYVSFRPTFWARGSGKKLRGNPEAQVLAMYLITCGHGTVCGIFHLALPTIAHETGLPLDVLPRLLETVADIAQYDFEEELCWIPNSAREQIGDSMSGGDKRRRALEVELKQFGHHRFVFEFIALYGASYTLETMKGLPGVPEGAPKGHASTVHAPSTAQHSTDTGLDQVEGVQGEPAEPSVPLKTLMTGKPPDPMAVSTQWPDDFEPNAENLAHALSAGLVIADEVADCRDYARKHARTSCDWQADLSSWMRKSVKFRKQRAGPGGAVRGRVPQENAGKTGFEGAEVI